MSDVTNCLTCGAVCRILGQDAEGLPKLRAFQNTEAQKKIEQLKNALHHLQETLRTSGLRPSITNIIRRITRVTSRVIRDLTRGFMFFFPFVDLTIIPIRVNDNCSSVSPTVKPSSNRGLTITRLIYLT